MRNVGRPAVEMTETMKIEVERLAALGFNERQIAEAIGISISTWQRNKEHFEHFLKKGRSTLRERIVSSLLARAEEGDTTALIFACKRLNLFSNTFDAKEPNNPQEAIAQLLSVYMAYANGEINETAADKMTVMLQGYVKAYEVSELEQRVKSIEEKTK